MVEELALLENVQREDLNIVEEAKAYQGLLDRGWSKERLAERMGFKQTWRIDEKTSLLKLDSQYQDMAVKGIISNSQAFEMSRVSPEKQRIVLNKIVSGELNTYNKLRSFVTGLIDLEKQGNIFSLTPLSEEERVTIDTFKNLLKNIERFIGALQGEGTTKHLRKATIHSEIKAERMDFIIQSLMKIRKTILSGEGIKSAIQEVA